MKGHFFNSLEEILLEKYSPQISAEIERSQIGCFREPSLFYLYSISFCHEKIFFQFFGRNFAGKIFASDLNRDQER